MNFILHGDFSFPLTFGYYFVKNFFVWSFQSGAPNLDGIIRFPGRLLSLLIFALFGNIAASYSYIVLSLFLVFVGFFLFCRYFLNLKNPWLLFGGSLLYTLNPAFLGNFSKIGLVAAAGMLPACLLLAKKFIETKGPVFIVGIAVALNYSLIHPFTFTVNLLVTMVYLGERLIQQRAHFKGYLPGLLIGGAIGVLLNAYLILPLANVGSIDKSALSQDVSGQPVDYFDLVEVANTKDLFTAFSLSKNVLKDFEFYRDSTKAMYTVGVYGMYVLAFVLFVVFRKRLSDRENKTVITLLAGLLGLLLLTTGTIFISKLIQFLISLPAGWIFRSPLKWQLYIPFFLMALTILLLSKVSSRFVLRPIIGVMVLFLALSSTFLTLDIYEHLIKPKHFVVFNDLASRNFDHSTLLYLSGKECADYAREHPDTLGEFNEISISRDIQVKTANTASSDQLNLSSYDYILSCKEDTDVAKATSGRFKFDSQYDGDSFRLYENTQQHPQVSAVEAVFSTPDKGGVGQKELFTQKYFHSDFNQVPATQFPSAVEVRQIFHDVSGANISGGRLSVGLDKLRGPVNLYNSGTKPLYYRSTPKSLDLSLQPGPGYQTFTGSLPLPQNERPDKVTYSDPAQTYKNLVSNGSFENGPWKKVVDDCYKYDDRPDISMQTESPSSDGTKSLALVARRHMACTNHQPVPVKAGSKYLFEFSFQSDTAESSAGYAVVFNDPDGTRVSESPGKPAKSWQNYTKVITAPAGASSATIYIYGYPPQDDSKPSTIRYDGFKLVELPSVLDDIFITGGAPKKLASPTSIDSSWDNPVSRKFTLKGVDEPLIVRVDDAYHSKWSLLLAGQNTQVGKHLKLNNFNAWYLDPAAVCASEGACKTNGDGTYDINLSVIYTPQRWFLIGVGISIATLIGYGAWLLARAVRRRQL